MRVLSVEDEPNRGRQLRSTLEGAGYAVDLATDGEDGHYLGSTESYDAIILDLGLPEVDGLTVLDRWRKEGRKMPVLVLTARDSWSDKVAGLDAGADDYLAKPFQTEELIARLRALIRRSSGNASSELIAGDIRLDTRSGKVTKAGEPVKLTAQEYKLLSYLMHHKGKVVSRRMIDVAGLWIAALLVIGGFALDRVLTRSIVDSFDNQLVFVLNSMITSSEIGPDGEVRFNRAPADQRFVEPYSGLYFQISGAGAETFPSRSLWDRRLRVSDAHSDVKPHLYDSDEFSTRGHPEPIRIAERDAILPGSAVRWRFQVAQSRETIDDQIRQLRSTLFRSFLALGIR